MSIYQSLYDLIQTYIFGGVAVLGSNQELICMLIASFGSIFLVAIPFAVVWKLILLITR